LLFGKAMRRKRTTPIGIVRFLLEFAQLSAERF